MFFSYNKNLSKCLVNQVPQRSDESQQLNKRLKLEEVFSKHFLL